jgi:hypothetical protein
MNWGNILTFVFSIFGMYEADKAIIDAGGVATSPVTTIGSDLGKQLYARAQLSTDKTFGGTA